MHEAIAKAKFDAQVRGLSERLAANRGWILHQVEYPVIDCEFTMDGATPLRVKMDCDNWDNEPPAITLLTSSGVDLPPDSVPRGKTNVFNPSLHPVTKKPFVCMRGSREYHTHQSHLNDPWEPLKHQDGYHLNEILTQLWNAWRKDVGT